MSKTWLITGATSGFGRIWMEGALARGDRVAAAVRNPDALADVVETYGDLLLPVRMDVTDREAVFDGVATAYRHFGRLDVVVSNAGYGLFGTIEETSLDDTRAIYETNVFGTLSVIQAAIPLLREQGGGHILPVSSTVGLGAVPYSSVYSSTKFAIEGIGEALAIEVAPFGIRVTLVEPGPYRTNFFNHKAAAPLQVYDALREDVRRFLTDDILGDPSATWPAIQAVVDAEDPPPRLILGDMLESVRANYEDRLRNWDAWQAVSLAAKGEPARN